MHFPSFSSRSVVYKVQGTVEILRRYYPEIRDPEYASTVTLGHARYSTNTNPIFERAQPFNVLGHNGEFNTISRFRLEAQMLGIDLADGNSDSQDVDHVIDALCMEYGLDLIEAMEYVFPPFDHDLMDNDTEIHAMYKDMRRAFGPFAQGPAAIAARVGDQVRVQRRRARLAPALVWRNGKGILRLVRARRLPARHDVVRPEAAGSRRENRHQHPAGAQHRSARLPGNSAPRLPQVARARQQRRRRRPAELLVAERSDLPAAATSAARRQRRRRPVGNQPVPVDDQRSAGRAARERTAKPCLGRRPPPPSTRRRWRRSAGNAIT